MPGPPSSVQQHEKRIRLWDTLKTRLSTSKKNGDAFVVRSSSRERVHRSRIVLAGPTTTCNGSLRNLNNRSIALQPAGSLLLCPLSQQTFTPQDDDTFSTRPLIGLTTQPTSTSQHYSEIWLADYIESTRKRPPVYDQSPTKEIKTIDKSDDLQAPPQQCNLEKEINKLVKALKKVKVANAKSPPCLRHHVSEYDVHSATSRTGTNSSSSEFSFVADFTQIVNENDRSTHCDDDDDDPFDVGFQNNKEEPVPSNDSYQTTTTNKIKEDACMNKVSNEPDPGLVAFNSTPDHGMANLSDKDNYNCREVVTLAHDASHQRNEDIPLSMNSVYQGSSALNGSARQPENAKESTSSLSITRCSPQSILPAQDCLEVPLEFTGSYQPEATNKPILVTEVEEEEVENDDPVEGSWYFPRSGQSSFVSEMTETTASAIQLLPNYEDESQTRTAVFGGAACTTRKAKCVVVYDTNLSKNETPANFREIREMVVRLEAIKRLESDHAEKFGYKGFLPIHELQK